MRFSEGGVSDEARYFRQFVGAVVVFVPGLITLRLKVLERLGEARYKTVLQ